MRMRAFLENYVKSYEHHFNNPNRNNITFENLQYASWLLDKYCKELNLKTYYKGCYEDCIKILSKEVI